MLSQKYLHKLFFKMYIFIWIYCRWK